jgi:hypothetical protein
MAGLLLPSAPRGQNTPSWLNILTFGTIDFRKNPELYQVGIGEQGVLLVEPYKSKILPHLRFRTPDILNARMP